MGSKLLEVIVINSGDAREAQKGGADRLELVLDLKVGGLTPSLSTVADVLGVVNIPVRVMLRQSANYTATNKDEIDLLCKNAKNMANLPIDGMVLGFINYGKVDHEVIRQISESAPAVNFTFHRAFETVSDPLEAIVTLKDIKQIDRILTNGGAADWAQRIGRLEKLQGHAGPNITIIAGGGVDLGAALLLARSNLKEIHIGRAARHENSIHKPVDAEKVSAIRTLLDSN